MTAASATSMSDSFETVIPAKRKRDPVLIGLWIALLIVAAIWLAPFVFIVFTSLKTQADVTSTGAFMPPLEPAFDNYSSAWGRGNFAKRLLKQRDHYRDQSADRAPSLGNGGLCACQDPPEVQQAAAARNRLRHHDPLSGDAGAAVYAGQLTPG